jgi:hypothetical protein
LRVKSKQACQSIRTKVESQSKAILADFNKLFEVCVLAIFPKVDCSLIKHCELEELCAIIVDKLHDLGIVPRPCVFDNGDSKDLSLLAKVLLTRFSHHQSLQFLKVRGFDVFEEWPVVIPIDNYPLLVGIGPLFVLFLLFDRCLAVDLLGLLLGFKLGTLRTSRNTI